MKTVRNASGDKRNLATVLLLVTVVVWLALLGGGIVPGSLTAAALVTATAWTVMALRRSPPAAEVAPVGLAGALILVFLLVTALPVSVVLTAWHGGLRYAQNLEALARFTTAAELGLVTAPVRRFALSRNIGGTLRILVLAAVALSVLMLAARLPARSRRGYLRFLIGCGVVMAGAGMVSRWLLPQGDTLWWWLPVLPAWPGPVACFANRNHYAGFLALLAAPALVLLVDDLAARRTGAAALMLAAALIMIFEMVMAESRGALLALVAGTLAAAALLARSARTDITVPRRLLPVLLIPAAGGLLVAGSLWLAPLSARQRLREAVRHPVAADSSQARREAWRETLAVWRNYPWVGAGANALRTVYPQHRTGSRRETRAHAENQYLQLLAETGVIGTALAAAGVLFLLRALRTGRRQSVTHPEAPAVNTAAAAALAVAAVHALVDFPHHVPVYAVVMASVAGLGMPLPDPSRRAQPGAWRPAALCLAIVLLTAPAWRGMYRRDDHRYLQQAALPELMLALSWTPTSWTAWYEFGRRTCAVAGDWETFRFGADAVSRAAALDPNNYLLWYEMGQLRLNMGDRRGARRAFERVRQLRHWVRVPNLDDG